MDYGTDVTLLSSIGCGRTFLEYMRCINVGYRIISNSTTTATPQPVTSGYGLKFQQVFTIWYSVDKDIEIKSYKKLIKNFIYFL